MYGATSAGPGSSAGGHSIQALCNQRRKGPPQPLFAFTFDSTAGFGSHGACWLSTPRATSTVRPATAGTDRAISQGRGTVFELSLTDCGAYTESVPYSFFADDGHYPQGLVMSGSALYGTTSQGGGVCASNKYGCGTVFSVVPGRARPRSRAVPETIFGKGDGFSAVPPRRQWVRTLALEGPSPQKRNRVPSVMIGCRRCDPSAFLRLILLDQVADALCVGFAMSVAGDGVPFRWLDLDHDLGPGITPVLM